jgi:NitT/TauT family transport system ATP-binding protein
VRGAPILIEEVEVDYPVERRSIRTILRGITLDIQGGEFVSIVGQTGCGKSTLLRLILGEERPTRGRVLVDGVVRTQPDRHCGYVPQRYSLFPHKTVLDNVTFGPEVTEFGPVPLPFRHYRRRREEIREEALRYLRHTGLQGSDARKYPHQLSGGMQQRVAIAQALIMKPSVLLMDEPFSALDPGTRAGMQRLIWELWRESGTTIVFVTHDTREAVCLGSRVVALAKPPRGDDGASVVLDLGLSHVGFDSSQEEIRRLVQQVEAGNAPLPGFGAEGSGLGTLDSGFGARERLPVLPNHEHATPSPDRPLAAEG